MTANYPGFFWHKGAVCHVWEMYIRISAINICSCEYKPGKSMLQGNTWLRDAQTHMEGSGFKVCLVKTIIVDYSVKSECAGKKRTKAE